LVQHINPAGSTSEFPGRRFAIIVSTYHELVTDRLREGAIQTLRDHRIADELIDIVRVPGAWELALAASEALKTGRYAGVICLGAVIRGETTHDQHINRFVSHALGQLSLDTGIPVGFGLLTCQSFQQAHERAGGKVGNKGQEAALAMLEMVHLCDRLQQQ
jgi:6,7-dimethyl-8-ribityllumazine synthase